MIGEHGFTAMLREAAIEPDVAGVVGAPGVNPTRSGLRIEDSHGAAIDAILLEDIARDKHIGKTRDVMVRAGPLSREDLYWNVCEDELDAHGSDLMGLMVRAGPLGREDLYWNVCEDELDAHGSDLMICVCDAQAGYARMPNRRC
jgi:hypothetical protein